METGKKGGGITVDFWWKFIPSEVHRLYQEVQWLAYWLAYTMALPTQSANQSSAMMCFT